LSVLGGLALAAGGERTGPSAFRRRPLALLAILAAAGARGVSRERLLLYLWPESDARRGRNTLNQTLYALRRDLGADDVVVGTTALALNPAVVGCDLWEFERALAAGRDEDAVGMYGGPFLAGFSIAGLLEFEEWSAEERRRLARAYEDALGRLAAAASAAGDRAQAVRWWRRLAAVAPLSTAAAAGLMRALAAAGDRAAALEHARIYTATVRAELDAAPDADVTALAEQIRSATECPPAPAPPRLPLRRRVPPTG
jgi:DNA-binding SARP family transcriptional activator